MTDRPKSVADMTPQEYFEYLLDANDADFMKLVSHDVKKVVSVVHGYLSLMRLDIEEGTLETAQLQNYLDEMEDMLQKSYVYMDAAEDAYTEKGNG
jgi:hypothetical protein